MLQILTSIITSIVLQTSIYTISFVDASGNALSLNEFRGKTILIVNIATESPKVSQLADLQALHNQFPDSLVIIAIPSNSFGKESKTTSEIKNYCIQNYQAQFIIGSKVDVTGNTRHPIYNWLAKQSENGAANTTIATDFQKYLIDKEGNLIGQFSSIIKPTDSMITNLIINN